MLYGESPGPWASGHTLPRAACQFQGTNGSLLSLQSEDSDEDEPCAISGKWTFQRDSKRWSRLEEFDVFSPKQDPIPGSPDAVHLKNAPSHENMQTDLSDRQEVASVHSTGSLTTHAPPRGEAAPARTNSVLSVCSSAHAGKEGPQLASTGPSQGFPRAAAPLRVFSRCTMRISGSLPCGAREVRSPCAWRGRARHGSRVAGGD